MKKIVMLCVVCSFLLSLCACGQGTDSQSSGAEGLTWQEQYDLGLRYLEEGNYEEAIIAFTAAIEIDPKRAPAYEKLADAYIGMGDIDEAKEVLESSLTACGEDASILAKIKELESQQNLLKKGLTDNMVQFEEVKFLGRSIKNLDIETMKSLLVQNGFNYITDEELGTNEDDYWWVGSNSIGTEYGAEISALQYKNEDYVCLWGYTHFTHAIDRLPLPIGVRNIRTCDTLETVLTQLGFLNGFEISESIQKIATTSYSSKEEILELLNELECRNWEPETEISTRFMFTGNGSCTILDDGTFLPAWIEFEVSFFHSNEKSYSLTFRFGDTSWGQFSDCLYSYDVNVW